MGCFYMEDENQERSQEFVENIEELIEFVMYG